MEFDPYAHWLKIPTDRRPPTYYDLLGLPPYEADQTRIRQSVLERSEHVRRYQLGQHSHAAIQLLSELSRAFDTLTTPERKRQYDCSLAGMATQVHPAALETVVAEAVPMKAATPEAFPVPSAPPLPIALASSVPPKEFVQAVLVPNSLPPLSPVPVPTSPFQAGYTPGGIAPTDRRGRSGSLSRVARRTPGAVLKTGIKSIVLTFKAGFWSLRLADRAMCKSLGAENAILHNFVRFVVGSAVLCGIVVTIWYGTDVWRRMARNLSMQSRHDLVLTQPSDDLSATGPAGVVASHPVEKVSLEEEPTTGATPDLTALPAATPPAVVTTTGAGGIMYNSLGMQLAFVPPGQFSMGSPATESNRVGTEHLHEVHLSRGLYMGVHEVTQGQFQMVMGTNPSHLEAGARDGASSGADRARLPVDSVLWSEANEFCRLLSIQEAGAGRTYRLPTEAEWEYACRAGTKSAYHVSDRLTSQDANYRDSGLALTDLHTRLVGSYPSNAWGLCDMHGNVEEWCSDYYDYGYYRNAPAIDPRGPNAGINRVCRGGSYLDSAEECRSARRIGRYPGSRNITTGFRVVCEVK